jgi:N-acetyl sugar amidotransferase
MIKWCRTCCIPDTRPDTYFDASGQCSACVSHAKRPLIDWPAREAELIKLLETTPRNGSGYDCIVPSSGGKDSTWQVLKMIELGARPLVVTATTCHLTPVGRLNIDNLARYATTIEVTANRTVRAKLNRLALEMVGDISWPEHCTIFTTPFKMAVDLGIPLIFYGENPQEAYGGPQGSDEARQMTRRWVSEFGGFLGLRPADFVGLDGISARDMADYLPPAAADIERVGVQAHFLGQYYQWNSRRNADVARTHGMQYQLPCEANWWADENLDNAVHGLHDWFGYLKYGYGRGAAQISVDVRNGEISRAEAIRWVAEYDGMFQPFYMDVLLVEILDRIGMTRDQLIACADRFANLDIFNDKVGPFGYELKDLPC